MSEYHLSYKQSVVAFIRLSKRPLKIELATHLCNVIAVENGSSEILFDLSRSNPSAINDALGKDWIKAREDNSIKNVL